MIAIAIGGRRRKTTTRLGAVDIVVEGKVVLVVAW